MLNLTLEETDVGIEPQLRMLTQWLAAKFFNIRSHSMFSVRCWTFIFKCTGCRIKPEMKG